MNPTDRPDCVLCRKPAVFVGLFVAKDQSMVNAPIGKTRVLVYHLCQHCREHPKSMKRVERMIFKDFAFERN